MPGFAGTMDTATVSVAVMAPLLRWIRTQAFAVPVSENPKLKGIWALICVDETYDSGDCTPLK